jgi:hypothetical protein
MTDCSAAAATLVGPVGGDDREDEMELSSSQEGECINDSLCFAFLDKAGTFIFVPSYTQTLSRRINQRRNHDRAAGSLGRCALDLMWTTRGRQHVIFCTEVSITCHLHLRINIDMIPGRKGIQKF